MANDPNVGDRRAMLRKMLAAGGIVVGAPIVQSLVLPTAAGAATTSYNVFRLQFLRDDSPGGAGIWTVESPPDNVNGCTPSIEPAWSTLPEGSTLDATVTETYDVGSGRLRVTVSLTAPFTFVVDPPFVDLAQIRLDLTPATSGGTCQTISPPADSSVGTRNFTAPESATIIANGARIRFGYGSAIP